MKIRSGKVAILTGILMSVWLFNSSLFASNIEFKKGAQDIVIVLHGLGRTKSAMWMLASRIEKAGFRVARIGYHSLRDTPDKILKSIDAQIKTCCAEKSPKIHFVGHSLGGLIVRAYINKTHISNLGRVVLIGTPNKGSEIVDVYGKQWWFKLLGPTAQVLGTGKSSLSRSLPKPDYPVGVIAGKSNSQRYEALLPGLDDGLVSVESAKVEGMKDFILVETSHSMMRYNKVVANETIHFLRQGRFGKKNN